MQNKFRKKQMSGTMIAFAVEDGFADGASSSQSKRTRAPNSGKTTSANEPLPLLNGVRDAADDCDDDDTPSSRRARKRERKAKKKRKEKKKKRKKDNMGEDVKEDNDDSKDDRGRRRANKRRRRRFEEASSSEVGEEGCDDGDIVKSASDDAFPSSSSTSKSKSSGPSNEEAEAAGGDDKNNGIGRRRPPPAVGSVAVGKSCSKEMVVSPMTNGLAPQLSPPLPFEHKFIVAPMVGASELAFRLLCRQFGAQLAYTPMISSSRFARDPAYREEEFQVTPDDRPLVAHFSANDPHEFAACAKLVEGRCDAIDLNLGCPQRTAYVGHFGSYLLDRKDRGLVLSMVRAARDAVSIPVFVKIRLLDTLDETIELCEQLRDAGASLIAVHARYRASFERNGPGARDGPAMLDQVREIRDAVSGVHVVSNGNVVTYDDVVGNLKFTGADGVMSAEGILDNPALFLPSLFVDDGGDGVGASSYGQFRSDSSGTKGKNEHLRKRRKALKKLREIEKLEERRSVGVAGCLNSDQEKKLSKKDSLLKELEQLERTEEACSKKVKKGVSLGSSHLRAVARDKIALADEYIILVKRYPVKIRSVVFHIRRMCRDLLTEFQLMEECISCKTVKDVECVLDKCRKYRSDPASFVFDRAKAARQKDALEKKKLEEGKRKAFEARMVRKAKREGRSDLDFYLREGAEVPTVETVTKLRKLSRDLQLSAWKRSHSQHCMSYHLDDVGCSRGRTCAFLHVDAKGRNAFNETDEIAG